MQVNSILVNINIIMGSYGNGSASPTMYSFYPNVAPGYKIVERPNPSLIYYPLSRHDISRMRVSLTEQHGNLVDLRGETITIRIYIREVKSRGIQGEILKEIVELKKYLKTNLEKGFIRESKSLAGYLLLFAAKKDGLLRPCINY